MSGDGVVEWITADDACKRLGKSSKTLERMTVTGEIETRLEPIPGRKPRRLFYAPAIERLADQHETRKRARVETLRGASVVPKAKDDSPSPDAARSRSLLESFLEQVRSFAATPQPLQELLPLWLKLAAAARYSGLAQSDLKALGAAGEIQTRRSGRALVFQRHSLDEFSRK